MDVHGLLHSWTYYVWCLLTVYFICSPVWKKKKKNWLKRTLNENKETMYICLMWHQSKYCSTLWNNRKLPCPKKKKKKKREKREKTVEWMNEWRIPKVPKNMTKIWVNSGFLSEQSTVLYVKKCACVLDEDGWTLMDFRHKKSRNVWNDQMPHKHYRTIHPCLVVF